MTGSASSKEERSIFVTEKWFDWFDKRKIQLMKDNFIGIFSFLFLLLGYRDLGQQFVYSP
jgi:hypothetical protein